MYHQIAVAWTLWKDMMTGLQQTNSNYLRTNTLVLVRALLSNPAPSGGALGAAAADAVKAFEHTLLQRTAFSASMLKDVLRVFQLWSKRIQ